MTLARNDAAMAFLSTRRSRPGKTLVAPGPSEMELAPILEAALRVPDHGMLEPWRLIVLEGPALHRFAAAVRARGPEAGIEAEKVDKAANVLERGPVVVAVVAAPVDSPKIPRWEQDLSAGAVCLGLVNAALASGWGANWLSGWASYDPVLCAGLGLEGDEKIAGFIHIGTEGVPPAERNRPDLSAKVTRPD